MAILALAAALGFVLGALWEWPPQMPVRLFNAEGVAIAMVVIKTLIDESTLAIVPRSVTRS